MRAGGFFGLTRGATRAHLARAVLEGIAQRGRDLVESAEPDGAARSTRCASTAGMSANATFLQLLADVTGRVVEVAPVLEATTRGAGLLALLGSGRLRDEAQLEAAWRPSRTVEPVCDRRRARRPARSGCAPRRQALRTIPSLSGVSFA